MLHLLLNFAHYMAEVPNENLIEDHHMGDPSDHDGSPKWRLHHEGEEEEENKRHHHSPPHSGSKRPTYESSGDERESSRKRGKRRATEQDELTWRCEPGTNLIIHKTVDCSACQHYASHFCVSLMALDHSIMDVIRMHESNITSTLHAEQESFSCV